MFNLDGKRIFVSGHKGMVGSALMRILTARGSAQLQFADRSDLDLTDKNAVDEYFSSQHIDVVIHAAGRVGGIAANQDNPVAFMTENLLMAENVISAAYKFDVKKLAFLGSSCIYPRDAKQPISADQLLGSPLEPSNEAYALAKIMGVKLCTYYRRQYGADFISLMPCNLYGVGDHYDALRSHVIPALLLKFYGAKQARENELSLWGTGAPLREFLYVDDLARGVLLALETYSDIAPLNIGSGQEITIAALAKEIAAITGYEGKISFDNARPDGTMRKCLDSQKINALGFAPQINLRQGLKLAYDDFLARNMGA